jgi:hypothetical protein
VEDVVEDRSKHEKERVAQAQEGMLKRGKERQSHVTKSTACRGKRKATVPHRIGSPTPVSHIAKAIAIPTAAFMIVIVTRYAEMSFSICCEISTT